MSVEKETEIWSVVANIVDERPYGPGGIEKKKGTKHFPGGAKVYVIDSFPGECDSVVVVGHHRKSLRLAKMVISVKQIHRLRLKLVYSLNVKQIIEEHYIETGPRDFVSRDL